MNKVGGPGILPILHLLFYILMTVGYDITLLLDYFWTPSILSNPTDKAAVIHWERKSDHRWIHKVSQFTCIVQILTVTLSH
jgi:hypothetical protein